jgi:hypothetical protein
MIVKMPWNIYISDSSKIIIKPPFDIRISGTAMAKLICNMLSLLRYYRSALCNADENLISNCSAKIGVELSITDRKRVSPCGHYFVDTKPFFYFIHKKGSSYQSTPSAGIFTSTECS